jgi:4-amino-4-deoxy-L-arabinose transferase-like glycosyltransferase
LKTQKNILILIASLTLLRLISAASFGYGVDEAHYVLYAKHLALSYFDHPPLVGWTHYVFSFFGTGEFWARVPAVLLGAVDSFLVYLLLKDRDEKAAFWAVVALNASLVIGVLFLTLMPDSLLITLMLLLIFVVKRVESEKSVLNYLLLGIVFGLLGLSKYTAVLLVPAFVIYLFWVRRADVMLNTKLLISFFAALFIITPVIVWNVQNDFASLAYQAGHVSGGSSGSFKNFFVSLGQQFGAYNPALFIIAFYGLFRAFKAREFRLESAIGVAIVVFMFVSQYRQVALPHWISPFFVLFVPIGVFYLYAIRPKLTKWVVGVSLILAAIVHAELVFKIGKFKDFNSPFRDIVGWQEAAKAACVELEKVDSTNKALAVTNWSIASRTIIYSSAPVYLIDERKDQFDIWESGSPMGKELLFVNPKSFYKDINASFVCDKVEKIGEYNATLNGSVVDSFGFELCTNFGGRR